MSVSFTEYSHEEPSTEVPTGIDAVNLLTQWLDDEQLQASDPQGISVEIYNNALSHLIVLSEIGIRGLNDLYHLPNVLPSHQIIGVYLFTDGTFGIEHRSRTGHTYFVPINGYLVRIDEDNFLYSQLSPRPVRGYTGSMHS